MTYPRSHLVDPDGGVYHICSRCVRRAWLMGRDHRTGQDLSHRREWLQRRIIRLSKIFAVQLFGFSILSNHYHVVVSVSSNSTRQWTDSEVVRRWLRLCSVHPTRYQERFKQELSDQTRVEELRTRLSSLSWFCRYINEPLARMANEEDGCKGRFWEGRFKSQRILDQNGLLAVMAYVDLNPVRAGMSTSIFDDVHNSLTLRRRGNDLLAPIPGGYSLSDYERLCTQTMYQFERRNARTDWFKHFFPQPGQWPRAVGSLSSLQAYVKFLGQKWLLYKGSPIVPVA